MKISVLSLLLISMLLTACGKKDPVVVAIPESFDPIVKEVERPTFNTNIDDEDAFNKALASVEGEESPQFVEVIDDLDADSVQAAEPGEKLALALEIDAQAIAEAKIREAARAALEENSASTGLEFRPYSEEFYTQVKGVRPAILYFTGQDCEVCANWETRLRTEAATFADKSILILMANFEAEADLVASMNIPEPGWAMLLTGIGELIGPRPTERLTAEELLFIFP